MSRRAAEQQAAGEKGQRMVPLLLRQRMVPLLLQRMVPLLLRQRMVQACAWCVVQRHPLGTRATGYGRRAGGLVCGVAALLMAGGHESDRRLALLPPAGGPWVMAPLLQAWPGPVCLQHACATSLVVCLQQRPLCLRVLLGAVALLWYATPPAAGRHLHDAAGRCRMPRAGGQSMVWRCRGGGVHFGGGEGKVGTSERVL